MERIPAQNLNGPDLASYDYYLLMMSGGKDSLASLLHLIDQGVPLDRIELWHHDVDGREGSQLMDWPVTRAYCQAVADHFGLPLYFSWKQGGFEGEMLRDDQPTAPTSFETPEGLRTTGGKGPKGTRLKFPQVSADLRVRWCSAYLKIDVADKGINNQERFKSARTLVITGERAQESAARSKYKTFEPHRCHRASRHVDHWRPVHAWDESEVWAIIERYGIQAHPAYHLGWGRLSCAACIFGSPNQWATLQRIMPAMFERMAQYEEKFSSTIQRKLSVRELAAKGEVYPAALSVYWRLLAISYEYKGRLIATPEHPWQLPAGAYGENAGPV